MKKKIGILAQTLQSENPRGACRVARAFAEQLVKNDEFEWICLTRRIPNRVDVTYETDNLAYWLNNMPIQKVNNTPKLLTIIKHSIKLIIKKISPPFVINFLRKVRRKITGKFYPNDWNNTTTVGPAGLVDTNLMVLSDLDAVLSFWWLSSEENFYGLSIERYQTKIIGWFLDAIPLRVSPDIYTVGVGIEELTNMISMISVKADQIVCISENSQRDLLTFFPAAKGKTTVIPCGQEPARFTIIEDATLLSETKQKFKIDPTQPYFICVGLYEASKNIINVLRAAKYLKQTQSELEFQLVLVGKSNNSPALASFTKETAKVVSVIYTDYTSDRDIPILMSGATALVYPSLWEGFGMPTLEAMSARTLVVTSDLSSLPEVCQNHAIYCDPYDMISIASAMKTCLLMPSEERTQRIKAAHQYALGYTWEKSTDQLLELIRSTVD